MDCGCLEKAKMLLTKTGSTCVLCGKDVILTDNRRGVRPLLDLLEGNACVKGFAAADKVVGKAAAYLYCILEISSLYAGIISQPALEVLEERNIPVEYGSLVPGIRNRSNDGPCPMENAVLHISNPEDALQAIRSTLAKLQSQ